MIMKGLFKRSLLYWMSSGAILLTILLLVFVFLIYNHIDHILFSDDDVREYYYAYIVRDIARGMFITTILTIISMSLLKDDRSNRWDMFLATTPVKPKKYVAETYLHALAAIIVFSFVCSAMTINLMNKTHFDIAWYFMSVLCMQSGAVIAVSLGLMMLFIFRSRFGTIGCAGMYFLSFQMDFFTLMLSDKLLSGAIKSSSAELLGKAIWLPVLAAILFMVSWFMSVRAYKRTEF